MASLAEMAEARLGNVQKAILDLEGQKKQIDGEIGKLKKYLEDGRKELVSKAQENGGKNENK